MAAFGVLESDHDDENKAIEVWPDNWEAVLVFCALATQWRVGFNGPTGLDYGVFKDVFRYRRIPRKRQPEVFESIRVMEEAALERMREASEVST